jgi:hypothetical protein
MLAEEIEEARLLVLPGTTYLRPSLQSHSAPVGVQPDALIESAGVYAFVEAKRSRLSAFFQSEQLAREYLTVRRDAGPRRPLLLLALPTCPPVAIAGQGRKSVREAIADDLKTVLEQFEGADGDMDGLCSGIDETVAWITWPETRQIILGEAGRLLCEPASVRRAIKRMALAAVDAIDWPTSVGV